MGWWSNKTKYKEEVWQKATDFNYEDHLDTVQFQKVCPWCGDAMIYDDFTMALDKHGLSPYSWTVGPIIPFESDKAKNVANLQAIHVHCELEKEQEYTIIFGTDLS